ncbi:helix-turn-helix domain-containing protein [Sphingomonas melonis]
MSISVDIETYQGISLDDPAVSGELLRSARQKKGLSVRQLAKLMADGTHFTTIGKIEAGKIQITPAWLERFSKALDVPVLELVSGNYAEGRRLAIPFYRIEDWRHRITRLGYVATMGSADNRFALQSLYENELTGSTHRTFIHIDPDDTELHARWIYMLDIGDALPFFGVYQEAPARFIQWPAGDGHKLVEVGKAPFSVAGRAIYYGEVL